MKKETWKLTTCNSWAHQRNGLGISKVPFIPEGEEIDTLKRDYTNYLICAVE